MSEQHQSFQRLIQALLATGQAQYNLGDYDGAIASHSNMFDHARKIADSSMESSMLAWLGLQVSAKGGIGKGDRTHTIKCWKPNPNPYPR